MKHEAVRRMRSVLFAVSLLGLVPAAYGATLYAANNGVDGLSCGASATPCRSITRAISIAAPGDTVTVRPGIYGDLNGNGVLGEIGEESPSGGCNCMLYVTKPVILISSDGAAATVIDASTFTALRNVLIINTDVEFGRPDHGFMVTNSKNGKGIVIEGANIKVRGNQVMVMGTFGLAGIESLNGTAIVLIEENQAIGWPQGIYVSGVGVKVSKNQVSLNYNGIVATDASVVGNVATGNRAAGIALLGAASAVGNAAYGNDYGFDTESNFTGVIQKNNMFGNLLCGLGNFGAAGVVATNNYWGAATGPGPNPADDVCNVGSGTTTTTPFATSKFSINPTFEP